MLDSRISRIEKKILPGFVKKISIYTQVNTIIYMFQEFTLSSDEFRKTFDQVRNSIKNIELELLNRGRTQLQIRIRSIKVEFGSPKN